MTDFSPQPVKGPESEPQAAPPEFPEIPLAPDLQTTTFSEKIKNFAAENKWYLVASIVGVIIIAVLAAIAFWPQKQEPTKEANVTIDIDAPSTVSAGGEVIYKVKITNQDSSRLVDMNLELVYDEGLAYISSTPKADNLSGSAFAVPDLATGQNAVVIVKTLAQGDVNDSKRLVARLHYSYDNFSSGFTLEQSHQVRLVASDVLIDLSGPEIASSGDTVSYKINYRNSSKKEIDQGRIEVVYPEGFEFVKGRPEPSLGKNIWNLGVLDPDETGEIEFTGTFKSANSGQNAEFIAEFLVLDNQGDFYTQSSHSFITVIQSRPLNIEQKLSGSSSGGVVDPGQSVTVELKYENNTDIANTGLQIIAEVDCGCVELSSLRSESGFVSDGTIRWDAAGVRALETVNAGSSGTLRYSFKLKNPATTTNETNLEIKLTAKVKSNENSTFIPGPENRIKVSSPVGVVGTAEHSAGALPPVVGQSSAFNLELSLSNSSNQMADGVLVAYVPTGVNLDTATFSNNEKNFVSFDKSTGKITWNFGQLVAHAGGDKASRKLSMLVTITPTATQLGQDVELLKDIEFVATDDFTGASVLAKGQKLTTGNLINAENSGRVQN
ncbi:MAG: hypothetical protein R3B41_00595 [Candidatus Doudnabacteria bacterium]